MIAQSGQLLSSSAMAVLFIASCARSERAQAPATATSAASSAAPQPTPAPPASAAAPPAAHAPAAQAETAAPNDTELPDRRAGGGSTVRAITCGKARCQAGKEVCVLDAKSEWSCVPSASGGNGFYACDDASDCTAPKACCRSFASAEEVYACERPDGDCAALVCSEPDGTRCPRGQRCSDGYCRAETQATCAGEKRCPASAPHCVWSGTPACVDEARAESEVGAQQPDDANASSVYACTKPSDCGTQQCCTDMVHGRRLTHCHHACDAANSLQLCARDSECKARARAWCGDNAACQRAVRCVPIGSDGASAAPPWMKVCRQLDY